MALAVMNAWLDGKLFAAYRPIVFQIRQDGLTLQASVLVPSPVVYCDIYINNTYYKSLSSTSYVMQSFQVPLGAFFVTAIKPVWTFDVQDVVQEYMRSTYPPMTSAALYIDPLASIKLTCSFRSSTVSVDGFIVPQAPVPVQGNFDASPVSGGGVSSPISIVVNSTLQHEDLQDMAQHLAYITIAGYSGEIFAYTITHRPDGSINCINQYDHYPVLIPWRGLNGDNDPYTGKLYISGKLKNGTPFGAVSDPILNFPYAPCVAYIPSGIPQLSTLTWNAPVPWTQIASYALVIQDANGDDAFITSTFLVDGCCCPDGARIHFLNALGSFDAVNFCQRQESQITKSSNWQKSLPISGMQKRDYGNARFNVRANDKNVVRTVAYPESAQAWLKELQRSPLAYIEWTGTQGQPSDIIPIKILDSEIITQKVEDRYEYLLEISYEMSNEKIVHRG